jgi:cell division protein FtsB
VTENTEKTRIESYLLGELSDKERDEVEEQFFTDDEFFNDIEAAEMALIDRYVRNEMPPEEREKLEQNYLVTPERRMRVADARAFHYELRTLHIPVVVEEKTKVSWFERLFGGLGLSFSAMQLAGASAIVILTVAVGWLFYDSMRLRQEVLVARNQQAETENSLSHQLEQKERELQEKTSAQKSSSETINTLEDEVEQLKHDLEETKRATANNVESPEGQRTPLIATVFLIGARGGSIPTQIDLVRGTKILNLKIPVNPSEGSVFEIKVTGDAGVVLDSSGASPRVVQGSKMLSVNIPAEKLHEGFYQVLTRNEKGEERTRSFVIRPK